MKRTLLLAIMILFAASSFMGNAYAASYPNVTGLKPFTSQTAYLSLIGYIQYLSKNQDGQQISREEAVRVLNYQKSGKSSEPVKVKKAKKARKHKAARKAQENAIETAEPVAETMKVEAAPAVETSAAEAPAVEAPTVEAPAVEAAPATEEAPAAETAPAAEEAPEVEGNN